MIYILSELHGVKQNSVAIQEYLDKYHIEDVFIEYFSMYEKEISDYVFKNLPLKSKGHIKYSEDGRLNTNLLLTLKDLAQKDKFKRVVLYATSGVETNSWNDREKGYIKNFKDNYRDVNTLIIGGHAHLTVKGDNTLGHYIKHNHPCEITKLIYKSGFIYNFGKRDVKDFENNNTQKDCKSIFIKKADPIDPKAINSLY